jgi:arabinan endo-1,5-alpha-L-arabinosidase
MSEDPMQFQTGETRTPPPDDRLKGAVAPVHDPTMAKDHGVYYVFCTGPGIQVRSSKDGITWEAPRRTLDPVPSWTATTIPGSREFYWAPDVTYFDHVWHLYYAVSTFGRNRSAIGLATNTTLDPADPHYHWVDQGPTVQSYRTDDYNAIDPHIALDEHKIPWMTFGSFWSGIRLVRLDPHTGKPADPDTKPIAIATRPRTEGQPGAIEAPFIWRHGRYFYLFVSFDFCCRGVRSTYNIRVGRSRSIDGPYVDRDGVPMLNGGGTLVLQGDARWKGPGHNCVIRDKGKDLLVYHAYDAEQNGVPKLRISTLAWDREGWPSVVKAPEK